MQRPLNILIDSREKKPLTFEGRNVALSVDKLDCGDYTMIGHDMAGDDYSIAIERKQDCQELLTNLGQRWKPFVLEAERLSKYKNKMIIVCKRRNFVELYEVGLTKLSPAFVEKRLLILFLRYQIPTFFVNSREEAEEKIYKMFYSIDRMMIEDE